MTFVIRPITLHDIESVAALHAASWRSAYRGMLRDEFLDSDLESNRRVLWTKRLTDMAGTHFGFIALDNGGPVGFAFAFGDEDPIFGTQLDNLHVLPELKGKGIGTTLLRSVCKTCAQLTRSPGLYLWVYEQNIAAQAFYTRLGAERGERKVIQAPGGGEVAEYCYAWSNIQTLGLSESVGAYWCGADRATNHFRSARCKPGKMR